MPSHGGSRLGAGRKPGSGKFGEPTVVVRVPASLKEAVVTAVSRYTQAAQLSAQEPLKTKQLQFPASEPPALKLPLFATRIPAGFPSPADDYVEARLDLNELLVQRQEATYFLRVKGDSMLGAGIHPGDLIVVDRSINAEDGHVVVADIDGELTIKRLRWVNSAPELHPENPNYPVIRFKEGQELRIWGVVTSAVHSVV